MKQNLTHLMSRVFNVPLLIAPDKLDVIIGVLAPRMGVEMPERKAASTEGRLERKPYEVTPDGIAIIPIEGTLVHKAYGLDAWSGMRSYQDIFAEVEDAATDPAIRGILLDVDSPGGEVAGCFDLADLIFAARGTKPVYAVADNDAFSAAYLLVSAADQVFVSRTSGVGSIGVIVAHLDQSAADQKAGLKWTVVTAGARKADFNPHAPLSKGAKAVLGAEVQRVMGMFVATVARNRGLLQPAVRNTEAALYFGQDAVDAGLADQMGTRQDALNALRAAVSNPSAVRGGQSMENAKQDAQASAAEAAVETKAAVEEPTPGEEKKPEEAPAPAAEPAKTEAPAEEPKQEATTDTRAAVMAEAGQIADLCAVAGMPAEASVLLKRGATVEQARKYLLERKAAAASLAGEIESKVLPGGGITPSAESLVKGGPMDAAVDRLIAGMNLKK